jgi:hypothetical protein
MVAARPGLQGGDTNGRVKSRGDAGRRVIEAYELLLSNARLGIDVDCGSTLTRTPST